MSRVVVIDADALIALSLEKDPHHKKAIAINKRLVQENFEILFPMTTFPEAITTLRRVFSQYEKANLLAKQAQQGVFPIIWIDNNIFQNACQKFSDTESKQNTFFDCLVVACAEEVGADEIFSFDKWYQKLGFQLAKL